MHESGRRSERMERSEKMMEAMGMEGMQATLPRESWTQEDERGWSQGRLRIPLSINQSSKVSCSGDSIAPVSDFSSCVLCSAARKESFSRLEQNLFLVSSIFMYIRVGSIGKNKMNITRVTSLNRIFPGDPKYFPFLKLIM